jgi:multiple sugar transport system ATP-binding protein
MARLIIDNLTRSFTVASGEKVQAIKEVNLQIEEQELMTLVGPSGSGKTTLLRLIAGLEEPDTGTIVLNGTAVNPVPPQDRDIAMVFQNYALYPHMSVYENLAFGSRIRKVNREQTHQRVQETAEMLGLLELLERHPDALSGGQRQRVALGRALVRRPKIILLDEPLSGLDVRLRAQMRREITHLQRQLGLTMLYVTHDQTEAMSLGNRIAVINHGTIQQVAAPKDLYARPCNTFVADFFGAPPMNFFSGRIVVGDGRLFFQEESSTKTMRLDNGQQAQPGSKEKSLGLPIKTHGFSVRLAEASMSEMRAHLEKEVLLGIRPEHVHVSQHSTVHDNQIEARTERIEMLGGETHLYLDMARTFCVARVATSNGLSLKDSVRLVFDMPHAHFFDPITGRRLNS